MATDVDKAEAQMNLTALQQFDPYITDILLKASQVALYLFNHAANEWEKTDIQGTMFVYKRSANPYYGFMIMNRLSLHNLTEPISKELEYTLQEPFLLYKTAKAICGIWFYNRDDCVSFARLIERLLDETRHETKPPSHPPAPPQGGGAGGIDIMTMLSKAQHEYKSQQGQKKKRSVSESDPSPIVSGGDAGSGVVIRPIPVKGAVSPGQGAKTDDHLSVPGQGGAKPKTSSMGPRFQRSVSMQEARTTSTVTPAGAQGQGEGSQVIPVLQRLMSAGPGPGGDDRSPPVSRERGQVVHTLESLEKMHTASDSPAGPKKPELQSLESIERRHLSGGDKKPTAAAAGAAGAPSTAESSQHLQRLLQRLQSGPDTATQAAVTSPGTTGAPSGDGSEPSVAPSHQHAAPSVPDKQPKQPSPQPDMNQALIEKLKSGSGSAAPATVSLMKPSDAAALTPNLLTSQGSVGAAETGRVPPAMKQLFPGPKDRKTPSPPNTIPGIPTNLLTPELIRSRSVNDPAAVAATLLSPLKLSGAGQATSGQAASQWADPSSQKGVAAPLAKEHLAEALIHLLRTDDDFLTKIHTSYLQSVQRLPP